MGACCLPGSSPVEAFEVRTRPKSAVQTPMKSFFLFFPFFVFCFLFLSCMFEFAKGIIPNGSLHPSWSKSRKVLRRESSQPLERSRSFPVGWPCSRNCLLAVLRRLRLTSVPEWLSGVSRERVSFRHAPQSVRARVCDGHVLACAFAPALDALPLPCPVICLFVYAHV